MQTLNLIKGYPPVVILQPSEFYDYIVEPPAGLQPSVAFIQTRLGTYQRHSCSAVDCTKCPFIEVSFRDYRIPISTRDYESNYCGGIDTDLFIRSVLSPIRFAKTKDLHETN